MTRDVRTWHPEVAVWLSVGGPMQGRLTYMEVVPVQGAEVIVIPPASVYLRPSDWSQYFLRK